MAPGSPGVFACGVTDPAGAYGFAIPVEYGNGTGVYYLQATLADAAALTFPYYVAPAQGFSRAPLDGMAGRRAARARIAPGPNDWTMQGTVTGVPDNFDTVATASPYNMNYPSMIDTIPFPYAFTFPAGWPTDCAMMLLDYSAPYNGLLYVRRGLNNTAGVVVEEDIDFSSPYDGSKHTYLVTERTTVNIEGAGFITVSWMTPGGANLPLQSDAGSSLEYPVIPAAAVTAGDRYCLNVGGAQSGLYLMAWSHAPFTSCELPDPFSCGLSGLTYTGLNHPGASMYDLRIGSDIVEWDAFVTPAWLAAAGSADYTYPDLSGLDGWQPGWGFDAVTYIYAVENEFNGSLPDYFKYWLPAYMQEPFADGAFLKTAACQPD